MEFTCDKINITDTEIGVEVHFENLNGDTELYFLIQRFFEGYHNSSYIETHDDDLIGHYRPKIKLGKSECTFEYDKYQVKIKYQIDKKKYKELEKILKILGSIEIEN